MTHNGLPPRRHRPRKWTRGDSNSRPVFPTVYRSAYVLLIFMSLNIYLLFELYVVLHILRSYVHSITSTTPFRHLQVLTNTKYFLSTHTTIHKGGGAC